jgi:hypothetical protein
LGVDGVGLGDFGLAGHVRLLAGFNSVEGVAVPSCPAPPTAYNSGIALCRTLL